MRTYHSLAYRPDFSVTMARFINSVSLYRALAAIPAGQLASPDCKPPPASHTPVLTPNGESREMLATLRRIDGPNLFLRRPEV